MASHGGFLCNCLINFFGYFPEIRKSGNPDFRISGYPEFRISGFPGIRTSGCYLILPYLAICMIILRYFTLFHLCHLPYLTLFYFIHLPYLPHFILFHFICMAFFTKRTLHEKPSNNVGSLIRWFIRWLRARQAEDTMNTEPGSHVSFREMSKTMKVDRTHIRPFGLRFKRFESSI